MIDRLAEAGLDMLRPRHLPVLRALDPARGARAAEIARDAGLTRQAIAQVLAELQQLGIVVQAPDPTDARAKIVRYTAFGTRGYRQAMAVFSEIEHGHAERLGARRIAQLKADLKQLSQPGGP